MSDNRSYAYFSMLGHKKVVSGFKE